MSDRERVPATAAPGHLSPPRLSPQELSAHLRAFSGSEQFYRLYPGLILTEGVKFLCDQAQCYWLMDCLYSYQMLPHVAEEPFQLLSLSVTAPAQSGLILLSDGNDRELHRQALSFTDFPLPTLKLYYTGHTVMLPREY